MSEPNKAMATWTLVRHIRYDAPETIGVFSNKDAASKAGKELLDKATDTGCTYLVYEWTVGTVDESPHQKEAVAVFRKEKNGGAA